MLGPIVLETSHLRKTTMQMYIAGEWFGRVENVNHYNTPIAIPGQTLVKQRHVQCMLQILGPYRSIQNDSKQVVSSSLRKSGQLNETNSSQYEFVGCRRFWYLVSDIWLLSDSFNDAERLSTSAPYLIPLKIHYLHSRSSKCNP